MFFTNDNTQAIISEVVNESCDVIRSTMSPNGGYVTISNSDIPFVTKDGKTVANALAYQDKTRDMIVKQIAQATTRTDELCGDGTTTTAFLIQRFYNAYVKDMTFGKRKLIEAMTDYTVNAIHDMATVVELDSPEFYNTLLTTANNDATIVDKVLEIAKQSPVFPRFNLRDGNTETDNYQLDLDVTYKGSYADPKFSMGGQGTALTFEQYVPIVFESIIDLSDQKAFLALLNSAGRPSIPKLLFARSFKDEDLQKLSKILLEFNNLIVPVQIAGSGSSGAALMKDISTLLNVKLRGSTDFSPADITDEIIPATVSTGRVSFKMTNDAQNQRREKAANEVLKHFNSLTIDVQRSALGRIIYNRYEILSGSTVTLFVGGVVEADISERKARYEDVYKVADSALRNGVIPGCGAALSLISKDIPKVFGNMPEELMPTVIAFANVLSAQSRYLLSYDENKPVDDFIYVNLATGETGPDAAAIGIYDAAMATATALAAGVKTALQLVKTTSVITGSRHGSVHIGAGR